MLEMRRQVAERKAPPTVVDVSALIWPELEARVVAAMLGGELVPADPATDGEPASALALCEDVELDDFAVYQHRAVIAAIRNLQAVGKASGPLQVDAWLAERDRRLEQNVRDKVSLFFLSDLLLLQTRFANVVELRVALRWLRDLAARRRAAR